MTSSRGKHIMKWGADVRHMSIQDSAIFTGGDDFGDYSFDGTFTGQPWGDFLLGIPVYSTIADTGPDFDSGPRTSPTPKGPFRIPTSRKTAIGSSIPGSCGS